MSSGPGHVERAVARVIQRQQRRKNRVWVEVRDVARLAYDRFEPTRAQEVAARRAMHAFVRKHPKTYALVRGEGYTLLRIVRRDEQ